MSTKPRTAAEYRAWWASQTSVPYGYCWCGCGQRTNPALSTYVKAPRIQGEPARYIARHHISPLTRARYKAARETEATKYRLWWEENAPVSYGLCWCGCGGRTNLSQQTDTGDGKVRGEPRRFLPQHHLKEEMRERQTGARARRAEEYRTRWERERPNIPYGYCWCGCGERTAIVTTTQGKRGLVRGEPVHYIKGHVAREQANAKYPDQREPNPSGLCMCGCGEKTSIAPYTSRKHGIMKGKPVRFLPGHARMVKLRDELSKIQDPNPSGLCMCGCGGETAVIAYNHLPSGKKAGHHNRYIQDHHHRRYVERHVEEDGPLDTPCWIWLGKVRDDGYGLAQRNGKTKMAHHVVYQDHVGAVPDGLVLDHICNQRACVRPDHLEAVPQSTNARAGRTSNVSQVASRAVATLYEAGFTVEEIAAALHLRKGVVASILPDALDILPADLPED